MISNLNSQVVFWMNYPSHHQSYFFEALRSANVKVQVFYYEVVPATRICMGWSDGLDLPKNEHYIRDVQDLDRALDMTTGSVHIIPPSLGSNFVRRLLREILVRQIEWLIWSEPARPGVRSLIVSLCKRRLGYLVNRYGLGALAIGVRAHRTFRSWGIASSKIAFLPYSVRGLQVNGSPDALCAGFCREKKVFAFLGSLSHRKGTDILLKAFALIRSYASSDTEWMLVLTGNDCSNGQYLKLAQKLGILNSVLFRGSVSHDQLSDVLRIADVVVLPSRFDGWGVVINEAASMGKALIATNAVGAAYHLVQNGYNGFRVAAGDANQLAAAMYNYVASPGLAKLHGKSSEMLFRGFTPEVAACRLISAIISFRAQKNNLCLRNNIYKAD